MSDLVAPAPEVSEHGPCVICGAAGVRSFFANQPFIVRERIEADGGVSEVSDPVPPISVCMAHFAEVFSERTPIGYCDDDACRRWGPLGEASPCGAPYGDLPEPAAHDHDGSDDHDHAHDHGEGGDHGHGTTGG